MDFNIRNFPRDLHKKARLQAVREDTTLKDLVIKLLTEYLKKQEQKRAKKKGSGA